MGKRTRGRMRDARAVDFLHDAFLRQGPYGGCASLGQLS